MMLKHSPRSTPREEPKAKTVLGRFTENNLATIRAALIAVTGVGVLQATEHLGPKSDEIPFVTYSTGVFPSSKDNIEIIYSSLETPEDLCKFIRKYVKHNSSGNFFTGFQRPPEEFQANDWEGPCSNPVRLACEWALRRGLRPYVTNLCSEDDVLADWHQICILKIRGKGFWIFDQCPCYWEGTLQEYFASKRVKLIPLTGIRHYTPMKENPAARLLAQIGSSQEIMESELQVPRQPLTVVARGEEE